ncbi:MAG: Flp pilus assembly complex ATPase component TadA [Deltaproteobacteria bacterium]|nr:Flp pilus assembly complex ATPase component TadA [Deltaproteobacteria bacterium]
MADRIGDLLIKESLINPEQLQLAVDGQEKTGGRLGYNLTKLGFITEEDLTVFLSKQYGIPTVSISTELYDGTTLRLVPEEVCRKYLVLPISLLNDLLLVAMADPSNMLALDDIRFLTGYNIETAVASESDIVRALDNVFVKDTLEAEFFEPINEVPAEESLLPEEDTGFDLTAFVDAEDIDVLSLRKLVNYILVEGFKKKASDIYIESYEQSFRIRYKIDGVLRDLLELPFKVREAVTARLKIMSKLDIEVGKDKKKAVVKLCLDDGEEFEYSLSALPTKFGEVIHCRLLKPEAFNFSLNDLGLDSDLLEQFKSALRIPCGIILISGAGPSGRKTTLYGALKDLNNPKTNIMTVEDPVYSSLEGVSQVEVDSSGDLDFPTTLKNVLAHLPDVVMVSDIKTKEVGNIILEGALQGCLILSSINSLDIYSAPMALSVMASDTFKVASLLRFILTQKLLRKICTDCIVDDTSCTEETLKKLGLSEEQALGLRPSLKYGKGCGTCGESGFNGVIAIFEGILVTEKIREAILNNATARGIEELAKKGGVKTLMESAIGKISEGLTTVDEVLRVLPR